MHKKKKNNVDGVPEPEKNIMSNTNKQNTVKKLNEVFSPLPYLDRSPKWIFSSRCYSRTRRALDPMNREHLVMVSRQAIWTHSQAVPGSESRRWRELRRTLFLVAGPLAALLPAAG